MPPFRQSRLWVCFRPYLDVVVPARDDVPAALRPVLGYRTNRLNLKTPNSLDRNLPAIAFNKWPVTLELLCVAADRFPSRPDDLADSLVDDRLDIRFRQAGHRLPAADDHLSFPLFGCAVVRLVVQRSLQAPLGAM